MLRAGCQRWPSSTVGSRSTHVVSTRSVLCRPISCQHPSRAPRTQTKLFAASDLCAEDQCLQDTSSGCMIRDDLDSLLEVLPPSISDCLVSHPHRAKLVEVVLDIGRRPEARFAGGMYEYLSEQETSWADLEAAVEAVGEFGSDNRAGIQGTLHRISGLRNRQGRIIGLTCRVGRAVTGHADIIRDVLEGTSSVLFLGRPGVGKTTCIREMARIMSDELRRRVVIVDTSNEIGGDGDVPHPAIGGARRMQVADASKQHQVMIEAVENHMPEVVIVDEIGSEAEALACRTIAERGVQLIATAHGRFLENLIKNPTLSDLVGGVQSVTLGDEEARQRGTQKSVLERRAPPTFQIVIEMHERHYYVAHWTERSVDYLLQGRVPQVQVRQRDLDSGKVSLTELDYDRVRVPSSREGAEGGAAGSNGHGSISPELAAEVASLLGSSDSIDSIDQWGWAERLKGMSREEVKEEIAILKYLGGQATILRPQAAAFTYLAGAKGAGSSSSSSSARAGKKARAKASKARAKNK